MYRHRIDKLKFLFVTLSSLCYNILTILSKLSRNTVDWVIYFTKECYGVSIIVATARVSCYYDAATNYNVMYFILTEKNK